MRVIGIDIGGTEIKAAIVNAEGVATHKVLRQTPKTEGASGILTTIFSIIKDYQLIDQELNHVGIGSAGRINSEMGKVVYATDNLPGWTGTNIKYEIESYCNVKVFIDNDVNVAAIGEQWIGAARDVNQFVLLSIGTGIGGAFVYQGNVVHGPTGGAGEIGHMIIHPNGKQCNCGQKGCIEQYISGSALNEKVSLYNPGWNSYTLLEQYNKRHPFAIQIIEEFIFDLVVGLINIQNLFDPELIIIGGGFGGTFKEWKSQAKYIIAKETKQDIMLKPAQLGNDAGIIGAAKLAYLNF